MNPCAFTTRPVKPEEFPDFAAVGFAAFGEHFTLADAEAERDMIEFERTLAAFDREKMAGVSAVLTQQLTVPGGAYAPMAGVTWIGVRPGYTRRGLLTRLLKAQLEEAAERGEAVSGLWASESQIYGRFGFAPAAHMLAFHLDRRDAAGMVSVHDTGSVRLLEPSEAAKVLPVLYEMYGRKRPGALKRPTGYWSMHFADVEKHRKGASAMFHAVHESAEGEADGYVGYRMTYREESGLANNEVRVEEIVAADAAVSRILFRFCLNLDLVRSVSWPMAPTDLALRWGLLESRRLVVTDLHDSLWLRILGVPQALSARTYRGEDEMVLEVEDAFLGTASGRFLLTASKSASACTRTRRRPMLRMGVAALSAAYLSGVSFATLLDARWVEEVQPGAAERADAMFSTSRPPYCYTIF